jgi:NADH-quinone oxidoreductase subunit H
MLSLLVSFSVWVVLPLSSRHISGVFDDLSILVYFCITSLSTYGVVLAGWGSYSRYAIMGGIRAVSQMISYELLFLISILPAVMLANSFNFNNIVNFQIYTC